jgi:hypothetical protein
VSGPYVSSSVARDPTSSDLSQPLLFLQSVDKVHPRRYAASLCSTSPPFPLLSNPHLEVSALSLTPSHFSHSRIVPFRHGLPSALRVDRSPDACFARVLWNRPSALGRRHRLLLPYPLSGALPFEGLRLEIVSLAIRLFTYRHRYPFMCSCSSLTSASFSQLVGIERIGRNRIISSRRS